MGEAKRRKQAAGTSGNEIDDQLLMRIGAVSIPHMKTMRDAVVAAFPDDDPDRIYALALGFQLDTLLGALKRPRAGIDNRKLAVDELNTWLAGVCEYRLTPGKSTSFETDMVMTGDRMDRIDETFAPHMHAMNKAVSTAFPNANPVQMYTIAVAQQLGAFLHALAGNDRPRAVGIINTYLAEHADHRLTRNLNS